MRATLVLGEIGGSIWRPSAAYPSLEQIKQAHIPAFRLPSQAKCCVLRRQTSPDTGTTQYAFNPQGQLTRMTRHDGSWINYQYDAAGRLVEATNPTSRRQYSYDWCGNGLGQLCGTQVVEGAATTPSTWTHYAYTPEGQLYIRRDNIHGSDDWTSYAYDSDSRLIGISYPSGVAVGYGYLHGQLAIVQATFNNQRHSMDTAAGRAV